MATAPPSSLFTSLTGVWSLLALRSDVDDIIIELLGRFDLEKIYADSNKDVYADLILALLAQLDVIFFIQRLTLPAPGRSPAGWSLGFLVSWEVTVRTVEFILQTVLEAREVLWDASFRDEYLARLLLSTVRILLLHPKPPANSKARDRRDRFARIQRSLERICDSYPDTNSPLLSVCRAIADSLCSAPDTLTLPPRMKEELPSLSEDLVSPPSPSRLRTLSGNKSTELTVGPTRYSIHCPTACHHHRSRPSCPRVGRLRTGYRSCWLFTMCHNLSSGRTSNMRSIIETRATPNLKLPRRKLATRFCTPSIASDPRPIFLQENWSQ